ncbi:hypothetical protein [Facklamia sp. 7083-14-GEN3]|uniref:hypothetical protein n=1 Tax=Facklamia sp. 7083-14-GEN3 TaxID=2973478 RepID=UPI00215B7AD0|nr:hypothetical protein [Facklamia sp. 7083-14-GEN3]MCR8969302.1 hypothetical protein [Facklamia sp. 7083-14-GEN3]
MFEWLKRNRQRKQSPITARYVIKEELKGGRTIMELTPIPQDVAFATTTQKLPDVILGLGKQQAAKYVSEMYQDPEFSDGVIKPTQKTTIVIISRFIDFLRKKDSTKFK